MQAIIICHFIIIASLFGHVLLSNVLIADNSMSRMIELSTRHPFCIFHNDRGNIRHMLLNADPRKIRQMTDDSITKLVNVCKSNLVKSPHQGGFLYPGTKWCGPGHSAANYSDLGYHTKEDMCCRTHDHCPKNMRAGECRLGICNNSPFTRSHCDCDDAFRRCLQNVNSETANTIGAIFYNMVQVICFKERSPCTQWQRDCKRDFFHSDWFEGSDTATIDWQDKKELYYYVLLRKLHFL